MLKGLVKVGLILTLAIGSLSAYDVEKEGDRWYVYNGNDLVGTYAFMASFGKYRVDCGNPQLSESQKSFKDSSNYYTNNYYGTQREAKNIIIQYCHKR